MKPPPPEWRQYSERGSQWLLRGMAAMSLRLGRSASRIFLYAISAYYFLFAPAARRAMLQYLRRVLPHRVSARDRLRLILSYATSLHDRLYLLAGRDELFDITVEGEDTIREAIAGGRALLFGAHIGNFEVLRSVGRRYSGSEVAITMYEDQTRRLNALFAVVAADHPPAVIAVGRVNSMLKLQASLEQGQLVGVLADRLFAAESSLPVPFLGDIAHFPTGPMRLAAMLQRRVVLMLGLYRGGSRYHVVFAPLADFTTLERSGRAAAVESAVRRYAALLEQHCRTDPYNWFNFYDFWREPPTSAGAVAVLRADLP